MTLELMCYDWASLRAAGEAARIPGAVHDLASAESEHDANDAYWRLDNVVIVQGSAYEAAFATTIVLVQLLITCTTVARAFILELLAQIAAGEPAPREMAVGNDGLIDDCVREIGRGLSIIIYILETGSRDERVHCIDLVGLCARADASFRERARCVFAQLQERIDDPELLPYLESWLSEL